MITYYECNGIKYRRFDNGSQLTNDPQFDNSNEIDKLNSKSGKWKTVFTGSWDLALDWLEERKMSKCIRVRKVKDVYGNTTDIEIGCLGWINVGNINEDDTVHVAWDNGIHYFMSVDEIEKV